MKIGDEVYIHGFVDEIRKDTVIIRNKGGYFGTDAEEVAPTVERKKGKWILTEDDNYEYCTCSECGYQNGENWMNGSDIPFCAMCGAEMEQ